MADMDKERFRKENFQFEEKKRLLSAEIEKWKPIV